MKKDRNLNELVFVPHDTPPPRLPDCFDATAPAFYPLLYGHGDVGALEEIDQAFGANVVPLRRAEGG